MISLDIAASEWKTEEKGKYHLPKQNRTYTRDEMMEEWAEISEKYPALHPLHHPYHKEYRDISCIAYCRNRLLNLLRTKGRSTHS